MHVFKIFKIQKYQLGSYRYQLAEICTNQEDYNLLSLSTVRILHLELNAVLWGRIWIRIRILPLLIRKK